MTNSKCIACGVELETGWVFAHCGRKECGVAHSKMKNDLIQRLRFVQSQGGGYYELAQDCIDLIEAMASVGIRQQAEIELLQKDLSLARTISRFGAAHEPSVSRLPVPGATMTRLSDIADELIRQLRKQGMEKMQAVFDGMRLRIDPWPESCTSDCVQKGYPDIDCPVHGKKTPPALPHCPSCLCALGLCHQHPGAVFHPPATCPECASGAAAYALLEVVKSGDGQ